MNRGKEVCELLRNCRTRIAEKYGLKYTPRECHHVGDCVGTCPVCDAELQDLQRQLDEKGITEINFRDVDGNGMEVFNNPEEFAKLFETNQPIVNGEDEDVHILEGDVMMPPGIPAYPPRHKRRKKVEKRRLYKQCKIAGLMFRDLEDVWEELEVGTKLALVREKDNEHDHNAIALALMDDYDGDPEEFDFDLALGYIPKSENNEMAALLDMGWQELFECEITGIKGYHKHGEISIAIYLKNKDADWNDDVEDLLYAVYLEQDEYKELRDMLDEQGYARFHWGGYPVWERDLPIDGDKVVFIYRRSEDAVMYLMHTLPSETFPSEQTCDDCQDYFLTNVKGPVIASKQDLMFLDNENVSDGQPDFCISAEGSAKLQQLFDNK